MYTHIGSGQKRERRGAICIVINNADVADATTSDDDDDNAKVQKCRRDEESSSSKSGKNFLKDMWNRMVGMKHGYRKAKNLQTDIDDTPNRQGQFFHISKQKKKQKICRMLFSFVRNIFIYSFV